jgi:DNA-binding NtrC family response regulator
MAASIFVVEDEALIRMMVVDMLSELGHEVVAEAGSIRDAEVLARDADFNLALFDINVAGNLITPITEIVSARGLPFILMSGYGSEGAPDALKGRPILRKPFMIDQLDGRINSVLGA